MSIHINAKKGDIAQTVLLPGSPLRARDIAQKFLTNPVLYNETRGMLGYTGVMDNGQRISVQGSGMGQPSLSIYVHELVRDFGVNTIIRVGTAGSMQREIERGHIVIAQGGCTDSALNTRRFPFMHYAPIADFELLMKAVQLSGDMNLPVHIGNVFSTDDFNDESESWKVFARYGVLAAEMETAELYTLGKKLGFQALTILTISDTIAQESEPMTSGERDNADDKATRLALAVAKTTS